MSEPEFKKVLLRIGVETSQDISDIAEEQKRSFTGQCLFMLEKSIKEYKEEKEFCNTLSKKEKKVFLNKGKL